MPSGNDQISVNEAYKRYCSELNSSIEWNRLPDNNFLIVFCSKKKKMNISQPIKQETKTESDLTVKRVEEDRGLATQVNFGE